MPGGFEPVAGLLANLERSIALPNFSTGEYENADKFEIMFRKKERITFSSVKSSKRIGFSAPYPEHEKHIWYKMKTIANIIAVK